MKHATYTIPSREEILGIFRQAQSPLDSAAVARALQVDPEAEGVLSRRLNAMERDGQLRANPAGEFALTDHSSFVSGRVSAHRDGFGFVIPEEGGDDLFLNDKEMQKVLHGDRVLARVTGTDRRGRSEGTIVEVVERANTHIIGRLLQENGNWVVAPEDKRIGQDILVTEAPGKAKSGQIVSVELVEQPSRFRQPTGRIVEVLGELDDPGMEIEIAVRKFNVPHIFSAPALKQANKLPNEVVAGDLGDRVDLRDVPLVTIDGEDARDFDDAVYCEPVDTGNGKGFRLLVAIADVSSYVKPNDGLDTDALERSTSVYFPRRVIPMLPEKLSNGLCSLNPAVDRLCLVCDMVVTSDGVVTAYQFYPAVMHSAARMTYNEVAAILADTKGPEAVRRPGIVKHLLDLNDAFRSLLKARQERGAIDFETTETYIVCNAQGKIEKILPRTRNDAHRLIEECMLAANVCAADFLIRHDQPSTFRIHAVPTEEKLNQLRTFLKQVGLNLGGGVTPAARDYAELMLRIKERPDAALLQTMLLRSMQQAVYSPDNVGHFGLAYEAYAHFTSPIRRYPDLLTHRAIKAVLAGKKYVPTGIDVSKLNTTISNAARKQAVKNRAEGKQKDPKDLTIWDALGVHCSANERRADEASRDVENWLKCYYMKDRLGEEFTGVISGVTSFGIFVQLDELFVEGLVHVTGLGTDFFQYDETRHELRGERTGQVYKLTGTVTVQVARVDLESRKIDLVLAQPDAQVAPAPQQREKGRNGNGNANGNGKAGANGDVNGNVGTNANGNANSNANGNVHGNANGNGNGEVKESKSARRRKNKRNKQKAEAQQQPQQQPSQAQPQQQRAQQPQQPQQQKAQQPPQQQKAQQPKPQQPQQQSMPQQPQEQKPQQPLAQQQPVHQLPPTQAQPAQQQPTPQQPAQQQPEPKQQAVQAPAGVTAPAAVAATAVAAAAPVGTSTAVDTAASKSRRGRGGKADAAPVVAAAAAPVVAPVAAPASVVADVAAKPVKKATAKPVAKAAAPSAAAPAPAPAPATTVTTGAAPAAKPVAKSAAKAPTLPAAQPSAAAVPSPVPAPAAKPAGKVAAKPAAKPAAKAPATPAAAPAVKPAAKAVEAAPVAAPAVKPAAQAAATPAVKPAAKAGAKAKAATPAAESLAKPATKAAAKPAATVVATPATAPVVKPAAKAAAKTAAKAAATPAATPAAAPATKAATKPAAKAATKSAAAPATPAAEPVAKSAAKAASNTAAKAGTEAVTKPASTKAAATKAAATKAAATKPAATKAAPTKAAAKPAAKPAATPAVATPAATTSTTKKAAASKTAAKTTVDNAAQTATKTTKKK